MKCGELLLTKKNLSSWWTRLIKFLERDKDMHMCVFAKAKVSSIGKSF